MSGNGALNAWIYDWMYNQKTFQQFVKNLISFNA